MNDFRPGVMTLLEDRPVPVIPMALRGLWGSLFSRKGGPAMLKLPRKLFARIDLVVGNVYAPEDVTMEKLQADVLALRGDKK